MNKKGSSIKKGVAVFCGLSCGSVILVFLLTNAPETWQALKEMRIECLLGAFILWALLVSIDVLRLQVLCEAAGTTLPFLYGIKAVLAYSFCSAITPFSEGGELMLVYMLKMKGIEVGKGIALTLVRTFLPLFIIFSISPVIIYFHHEYILNIPLKITLVNFGILSVIALLCTAYLFLKTEHAKMLVQKILHLLQKLPLLRSASFTTTKFIKWIEDFKSTVKSLFYQHKKALVLVIICTIIHLFILYSLIPLILLGLGLKISFTKVIMLQLILSFMIYLSPTPGGSGIAEGGFSILFAPFVPHHLLGITLVLWRFFGSYLRIITGALVVFKLFGIEYLTTTGRIRQGWS